MKIVEKEISELIASEYNPRRLSEIQLDDIKASLVKFGFVDPVIVNMHKKRKNIIVGGHQRVKVWEILGKSTVPCVEVKLSHEDEMELNIRLNKNTGEFDFDLLSEFFDKDDLSDWGFTDFELDEMKDEWNDPSDKGGDGDSGTAEYTDKVAAPVYEPSGENPPIQELLDTSKVEELIVEIEGSDVPPDVREFLVASAHRHAVFDYRNIAEFYAHADPKTQELMEKSALVIIDYDKAIENGFVKLSEKLREQFEKDHENDEK
jgi:hypothetical protein